MSSCPLAASCTNQSFFLQLQWAWYKCYVYVDVLVYTVKPSTTARPYLVVCADLSDSDGCQTVLSQLGHTTSAVACWTGYRMSVHQWNDKLMPKWMQASPIHMSNLYMPNCSGNWSGLLLPPSSDSVMPQRQNGITNRSSGCRCSYVCILLCRYQWVFAWDS